MYRKIIILIFCLINLISYNIYGINNYIDIVSKDKVIIEPSLENKIEVAKSDSEDNLDKLSPSITGCPSNIESALVNSCTVPVTWIEPTATDPSGIKSVSSSHNPGDNFSVGITTVTYTFTNNNDEISICSFDVTVKYKFFDLPNDQIINISSGCNTTVLWSPPSNCGISVTSNIPSGVSFPIGTTTVTYTAQRAGFFPDDEASFTVTVNDNVDPVLTDCPNDVMINANENCQAVLSTWNPPSVTDNCSSGLVPTADYPVDYEFPIGTTTVTYTATDEGGNTASCSFDVTVVDNTGPTFLNIPAEVSVSADGNCEAIASWTDIIAEDNCSSTIVINSNFSSGDVFPLGETTVEYLATDEAGNETIATFAVIVEDNTNPTSINCPNNITVTANANCEATATWDIPTFEDNCDNNLQVTASHNPGDTFTFGDTEVTYTATDDAGNQAACVFIVSVEDKTPPSLISIPNDLLVAAQVDACEAIVNWDDILAEDNCDDAVAITTNFNSGDIFPLGETTVAITATDDSGNESVASFTVTVEDTTAPNLLTNPADLTVSASANCESIVNWDPPTFSDNCDANLVITSTHDSGDLFPIGVTTVTYTATDNSNNVRTFSFDVTVRDEIAPVFSNCLPNIEVIADNQCQGTANWSVPDVSDNCNGEITLTSSHDSGDTFPLGNTTVTYTAVDEAGNSSSCSFEVTVIDETPPTIITQLNDLTVSADENNCQTAVSWNTITSEDNCSENVQISSSFKSGDIFQLGESTVIVTARDNAGNETTDSFKVTVEDNSAPAVISCPNDITVFSSDNCEAIANWEVPEFLDNCDADLNITSTHNPREIFPLGATLITYTATDAAGNERSCSFNVFVEDDKSPSFLTCVPDITLSANEQCMAIAEWSTPEVIDNCDANLSLESDFRSGDSFPVGVTTVTYTASDAAGNTNTCSFDVVVEDQNAPKLISCPEKQIIVSNNDCLGLATWEEPVFEDCSNLTISSNYQLGEELPLGIIDIEYTATDENGQSTICVFELEVIDETPPLIEVCPNDINVSISESCEAIVEWDVPVAGDNCSEVSIDSNFESGTIFPIGTTVVEYEFTDVNGNRSFCSFNVKVINESEIEVSNCPQDITLTAENSDGTAIVNWEVPFATSECSELTVNASHNPNERFEVGTTVVTYSFSKENGQSESCSFEVVVEPLVLEIEINKLISPNGDGNNDSWLIEGIEQFPDNQVIIVDRWGNEIYKASGYNNNEVVWRGENRGGELVPRGTYYYFISVRNDQNAIERKGFLEILR